MFGNAMLKRKPEVKHVPYQGLDENPLSFVELLIIDAIVTLNKENVEPTGKAIAGLLERILKRSVVEPQVYRALKQLSAPERGLLEVAEVIKNKSAPPSKPYQLTKSGRAAYSAMKTHYQDVGKYLAKD